MSSETSTSKVRVKPDAIPRDGGAGPQADPGLQPWQFFVLAALGCATAVTFMARGQGPTAVVLLGILMATAALVGYAALRTLRPLVTAEEDRTVMVGQRTRVALEREKLLTLRSIKELEFDRAMGRLSDEDWKEMSGRLRARAARLMKQLDAGAGYREQIEQDLAKRIEGDARPKGSRSGNAAASSGDESESLVAHGPLGGHESLADPETPAGRRSASLSRAGNRSASLSPADNRSASLSGERVPASAKASAERTCASCDTANDADARFCKQCGAAFAGQ
jgi:hypothetical protein